MFSHQSLFLILCVLGSCVSQWSCVEQFEFPGGNCSGSTTRISCSPVDVCLLGVDGMSSTMITCSPSGVGIFELFTGISCQDPPAFSIQFPPDTCVPRFFGIDDGQLYGECNRPLPETEGFVVADTYSSPNCVGDIISTNFFPRDVCLPVSEESQQSVGIFATQYISECDSNPIGGSLTQIYYTDVNCTQPTNLTTGDPEGPLNIILNTCDGNGNINLCDVSMATDPTFGGTSTTSTASAQFLLSFSSYFLYFVGLVLF